MKYLSKLVAEKFGGLENKTLTLTKGLNIIYGPNEAGKSTWAALIKMLFYGWGTKKEEKIDHEKYAKDTGFLIRGYIEDYKGKQICIERAKKDVCKSVYVENGNACQELSGAMPGKVLFCVERETFEKSTFVGQLQIESGKTSEIEQRLATIMRTGDASGEVSYEEARRELDSKYKELTGRASAAIIPKLESELLILKSQLAQNRALLYEINVGELELEQLGDEYTKMSSLSKAQEAQNAKSALEKIKILKAIITETEAKNSVMSEMIVRDGFLPDKEFVSTCEQKIGKIENKVSAYEIVFSDYQGLKQSAENQAQSLIGREKFYGEQAKETKKRIEEINATIALQSQLKSRFEPKVEMRGLKNKSIWMSLAGFVLVASAGLGLFSDAISFGSAKIPCFALAGVAALAFVIVALSKSTRVDEIFDDSELERALAIHREILIEAGCGSDSEFFKVVEEASNLAQDVEGKVRQANSMKLNMERKRIELDEAKEELKVYSKGYFKDYLDVINLKSEISALKGQISEIGTSLGSIENAKSSIAAILVTNTEAQLFEMAKGVVEGFDIEAAQGAFAEADALDRQIRVLRENLIAKKSTLSTKGKDLDEIEVEISGIEEQLKYYRENAQALALAISLLDEAYEEFSDMFAPELAKKTGKIFGKITGGKYDTVYLNSDFELVAANLSAEKRFDEVRLSAGTLEQLWISLRLAIVDLIYEKSEMLPPLVIDDAFVNFDDSRCKSALEFLAETAKTRQVILFTCHTRERDFIGGDHYDL